MIFTRRVFMGGLVTGLLSGCAGTWTTDYSDAISPAVSRGWRVTQFDIRVPDSLTVSEANVYQPEADIVWRGDPPGDRRAQVAAIFDTAARRGTSNLRGPRPVRLTINVTQFHALSDIARKRLSRSGVHNISFVAQVSDARTGQVLAGPEPIKADLVAYTGQQALQADLQGQTQKVRITDHLTRVLAGWTGAGPDDVRAEFQRIGR
ncbi:DUF6778 family protein [Rhodovulum strictum]|uniref:Lipoprotein n=1 Tax=Rhodovulum strictum TaxID=58314 RepID=A0A844B6R8_9RHOB|nr:DUF6778 family protein [Rhodovulum strictum]MRH20074.1 hypothetical protein [Rhodovulum strictum]